MNFNLGMHYRVWVEITHSFPSSNDYSVEFNDKWFHPTIYKARNYLSVMELKSIHVSKRGTECLIYEKIEIGSDGALLRSGKITSPIFYHTIWRQGLMS